MNDLDDEINTELGIVTIISVNYLDINSKISESVKKYADTLDTAVTPTGLQKNLPHLNKSKVFFKIGSNITTTKSITPFYNFGALLHLPKFENYWKLKFSNSDRKKVRGDSSIKRLSSESTAESKQNLFLGLLFLKNWSSVDIEYEPRVSTVNSLGIDHSLEFKMKLSEGAYSLKPAFEIFSDHNDGGGYSAYVNNEFKINKTFQLLQLNDGRYVSLSRALKVNHSIVLSMQLENDWSASVSFHQSYDNFQSYGLESRGESLTFVKTALNETLVFELSPYISYSRSDEFTQKTGVVVSMRFIF